jgi:hypothetical protein
MTKVRRPIRPMAEQSHKRREQPSRGIRMPASFGADCSHRVLNTGGSFGVEVRVGQS